MKQHITSLPHHPKRVIVLSLLVAALIGFWGYTHINQKPEDVFTGTPGNTVSQNNSSTSHQNLTLGFLVGGRIKSVSVKAGDTVKKGQVLATLDAGNAAGVLTQAKAAYATATANYKKVVNGATGSTVDVAKAAVKTAEVNLDGITKQQNLLVANAYTNLLNSTVVAKSQSETAITPPTISGTYTKGTEGTITITVNQAGDGGYFNLSGISHGTGKFSTTIPQPIGDSGLFLLFSSSASYSDTVWNISIPNTTAPNYLANYNAHQAALQTKSQMIATAQAVLDQANASLVAVASAARPEDVAVAQAQVDNAFGAVQVAEAAYANTIIAAPSDGTVVSVTISPGQIAIPNVPAIEFMSSTTAN